jgi:hypothetical protein
MFKISELGVSKFSFPSLYLFHIENPNGMPILPLTLKLELRHFGKCVVLESGIQLAFSVWKGRSERKPKFNTLK